MSGYDRGRINKRAAGAKKNPAATATVPQGNAARIAQMEDSMGERARSKKADKPGKFDWLNEALAPFKSAATPAPAGETKAPRKDGTTTSAEADHEGAWAGFSKLFDGGKGSVDGRVGVKDGALHGGLSGAKNEGGKEVSNTGGATFKKGNTALTASRETVTARGADGAVSDGKSGHIVAGSQGIGGAGGITTDGNNVNASLMVNGDGITGGLGFKRLSGFFGSLFANVGDDQYGGGGSLGFTKGKLGASASMSFSVTDDKDVAGISEQGSGGVAGAAANLFGSSAVSFGLTDAESLGGGVAGNAGPVSVSLSGYEAESQTTQFHTTVAAVLDSYDAPTMIELAKDLALPQQGKGDIPWHQENDWRTNPTVDIDTAALATMEDEASLKKLSTKHPRLFLAYMANKFEAKVEKARSFEDLKIDEIQAGEAFTYESGKASGMKGGVGVYGLGVSLGSSKQNIEQLSIGKDAEGLTQVKMTAMDEAAQSGGLDVAGGVAGLSSVSTKGSLTAVQFSVEDGEEGKRAMDEFQRTGLLPGAKEALAGDLSSKPLLDDLEQSLTELKVFDFLDELGVNGGMVDNPDYGTKTWGGGAVPEQIPVAQRREQMRAALTKKSGAVNQAMLSRRKWNLSDVTVPGITYTSHRIMDMDAYMSSMSLLGYDLLTAGARFAEYESKYRAKDKDEIEFGGNKQTNWILEADEYTSFIANPEISDHQGHEVELGMLAKQTMSGRERRILEKLPQSGTRPELMAAWVNNEFSTANQPRVSLAMTEFQLGLMGDKFEPDDGFWEQAAEQTGAYREELAALDTGRLKGPRRRRVAAEQKRNGGFREKFEDAEVERRENKGEVSDPSFVSHMIDHKTANASTKDEFKALNENEQGVAIASYVMRAVDQKGMDPWDAAHMVLAIDEPEVRNRHLRTLFMTYEHASEETTATLDFIEWVQNEGSGKLTKAEQDMLLSGVQVDTTDIRVNEEARQITEKGASDPKTVDWVTANLMGAAKDYDEAVATVSGRVLGESLISERRNQTSDWLQATDLAGGPTLVNEVMKRASEKDPEFVANTLSSISKTDPARARIMAEILADTADFGDQGKLFLEQVKPPARW